MKLMSLIDTAMFCIIMIGGGFFLLKWACYDIDNMVGYRTKMSKLNKDTWRFAHKYSGKVWIISGIINLIISIAFIYGFEGYNVYDGLMVLLFIIQIIIMLLFVPITEMALRKNFDKDGNKK